MPMGLLFRAHWIRKSSTAKLVVKQRVDLPLMSEVKPEVLVRNRALKPTKRVTKIKR